jgi:predicted transcriptional regulator
MEVHFTPEQQEQLAQFANRIGKDAEQVVLETVSRMLEDEARFAQAVQKGFASLDRGEYVEHEEVEARIKRLFQS